MSSVALMNVLFLVLVFYGVGVSSMNAKPKTDGEKELYKKVPRVNSLLKDIQFYISCNF